MSFRVADWLPRAGSSAASGRARLTIKLEYTIRQATRKSIPGPPVGYGRRVRSLAYRARRHAPFGFLARRNREMVFTARRAAAHRRLHDRATDRCPGRSLRADMARRRVDPVVGYPARLVTAAQLRGRLRHPSHHGSRRGRVSEAPGPRHVVDRPTAGGDRLPSAWARWSRFRR